MENLLNAIANFITDHWFLVFLVLFSFNPIKINLPARKEKEEQTKEKPE